MTSKPWRPDAGRRERTRRRIPCAGLDGSDFRNCRNLLIEGNRFINPRKLAIRAAGCEGLRLLSNTVSTEAGRRNTWNHPIRSPVDCSLLLANSTNVKVEQYKLTDPGVLEAGIYVDKECSPGPGGVDVRRVDCALAPGVPVVKDARP